MLQISTNEFHDIQGHCAPSPALGLFVTEDDFTVLDFDDAAIGDGNLEHIRGQVLDAAVTVGYGLAINVKGFVPDTGIDGIVNSDCL